MLLSGTPPFNGNTDIEIINNVKTAQLSFDSQEWKKISKEAKNLIRKMLDRNSKTRISAQQALNDPWFKMKFSRKNEGMAEEIPYILKNLQNFKTHSKLHTAVATYIGNYMQSKEEVEQLRKAFRELDINGDGMLEKEELTQGFIKGGKNKQEAEKLVSDMLKVLDINQDGKVNYSEFLTANLRKTRATNEDSLKGAFDMIDKDRNGRISVDELAHVLGDENSEEIKAVMKEMDKDENGWISFDEFKDVMLKIYHQT